MSSRERMHHCEDCGAVWPCTDPECDDTPITVCPACLEARQRWALAQQDRQHEAGR